MYTIVLLRQTTEERFPDRVIFQMTAIGDFLRVIAQHGELGEAIRRRLDGFELHLDVRESSSANLKTTNMDDDYSIAIHSSYVYSMNLHIDTFIQ